MEQTLTTNTNYTLWVLIQSVVRTLMNELRQGFIGTKCWQVWDTTIELPRRLDIADSSLSSRSRHRNIAFSFMSGSKRRKLIQQALQVTPHIIPLPKISNVQRSRPRDDAAHFSPTDAGTIVRLIIKPAAKL